MKTIVNKHTTFLFVILVFFASCHPKTKLQLAIEECGKQLPVSLGVLGEFSSIIQILEDTADFTTMVMIIHF